MNKIYDVAIVGSGIAGISAALTLKNVNKEFILFGNKNLSSKISSAHQINNYPGLIKINGSDMKKVFLKQLEEADISIEEKQVNGIYKTGKEYIVMASNEEYHAKTVILALGVENIKPFKGEENFIGRGVSYCATCDGFLYKDKTIFVMCTNKILEHEVEFLSSIAGKVYFLPRYKDSSLQQENIVLVKDIPVGITGTMKADKVVFKDYSLEVDGIFMIKDALAPTALVPGLKSKDDHVEVNRYMHTSLDGLFACGDCTGRPYQYAKAAGEGNIAAHEAIIYLSNNK